MFLVLPREHPLADKRNLRLADLADDAWIGGPQSCECNRLIYGACAARGLSTRGSPSRPTTTPRCRASSPPASACR